MQDGREGAGRLAEEEKFESERLRGGMGELYVEDETEVHHNLIEDIREELEYVFSSNSFRISSGRPPKQTGRDGSRVRSESLEVELTESPGRKNSEGSQSDLLSFVQPSVLFDEGEGLCCENLCSPCVSYSIEQGLRHGRLLLDQDQDFVVGRHGFLARVRRVCVQLLLESSWLCLCLLGIITSILAWCIDESVAVLIYLKALLANSAQSSVGSYLLWALFTTLLSVAAVFSTELISPLAGGSGIPQMRSILSGFQIKGYLSQRTLVSKILGLLLALSSGMVIGKEGPFVHIASIIANQMLRIPVFVEIRNSPALRKQILAAACAVGVSSTFGAPIGGVLFSIEVTSSLYQTSEYWKSYFCVVSGAFVFKELSNFGQSRNNVVSLFTTDFEPLPYHALEIPLFLTLAAICGYLGGFFVVVYQKVAFFRKHGPHYMRNSYAFAMVVSVVTSAALFPLGDFMQYSLHNAIDDLFVNDNIQNAAHSKLWDEPTRFINLLLFAWIKFFLCVLAINLPIPCGVFTPLFAVGAAVGRFFGELVQRFGGAEVTPGGYALVGAASFTAGATGTVSTAVIVFELTNQLSYMLPCLLAVLTAHACARQISVSIYESLAKAKNLPSFPNIRKQSSYSLPISEIMHPRAPCIPRFIEHKDIEKALLSADNTALDPLYLFAIVDDLESKFFLRSISWKALHILKDDTTLWKRIGEAKLDLFRWSGIDQSTLAISCSTPLHDAINLFDVHKRKSFFVVRNGVVLGKLYLKSIVAKCDDGEL